MLIRITFCGASNKDRFPGKDCLRGTSKVLLDHVRSLTFDFFVVDYFDVFTTFPVQSSLWFGLGIVSNMYVKDSISIR